MPLKIEALLQWYQENKRDMPWRETKDPYRIWLSEVMLQQTQVVTVIPYYLRFLERFPTIRALANGGDEEVLKLWEGLGYYTRCHKFLEAVRLVNNSPGGQVPDCPDMFHKLPGVGPYTTAAVMSIAFGHPLPVMDGNVIRVISRYYLIKGDTSKVATRRTIHEVMSGLIPDDLPGDFNQSVMELGATVCTPQNPICGDCPLKTGCNALRTGETDSIPFKPPKKKVPCYEVALGVFMNGNQFLIQKRPSTGHLAGMWEFPGGKLKENETHDAALKRKCKEELSLSVRVLSVLGTVNHTYSHFKVRLKFFACEAKDPLAALKNQPLKWIHPSEILDFPFPSANHKFFPMLKKALLNGKLLPNRKGD